MVEVLLGFLFIAILLFDIFQAVLVPRFTPASLRFAPLLIGRIAWPVYRKISAFIQSEQVLDFYLGAFAPLAFVLIFSSWLIAMAFSFALIVHGLGHEFHPIIQDFPTAVYVAGTSLLTLGFGDIIATSAAGRAILLLGAATGITVVAVAVSFLFSMQQSVHSREVMVNTFQSRIAAHASAVHLLLNYADLGITDQLANQINSWEVWSADVLASHRAFPLLCYFRSGHMCVSWITTLGIMLDAANLLSTTVDDRRFAHSEFFLQLGCKLVNFLREYLRIHPAASGITREEFHRAYKLLEQRGYHLHEEEQAWEYFHITRSQYAPSVNALAFNFVSQAPRWLEDQTNHHERARHASMQISTRH